VERSRKTGQIFSKLGITSVWFPPAYKGTNGGYSIGYDAYDLYDLGEFDQKGTIPTKYGTKNDYLKAIKALKKQNIEMIVDIVLGHKAGGDELEKFKVVKVDEDNREKVISDVIEIESYTKFTFPGRKKNILTLNGIYLLQRCRLCRRHGIPYLKFIRIW
jgi:alpha-amylase